MKKSLEEIGLNPLAIAKCLEKSKISWKRKQRVRASQQRHLDYNNRRKEGNNGNSNSNGNGPRKYSLNTPLYIQKHGPIMNHSPGRMVLMIPGLYFPFGIVGHSEDDEINYSD